MGCVRMSICWILVLFFAGISGCGHHHEDHPSPPANECRIIHNSQGNRSAADSVSEETHYLTTYVYDDGKLVLETTDRDIDGTIDARIQYVYDLDGNRIEKAVDQDNDGAIDSVTHYVYDEAGYLVAESRDTDNDGVCEIEYTYIWECD